jgi:hypothetical protein
MLPLVLDCWINLKFMVKQGVCSTFQDCFFHVLDKSEIFFNLGSILGGLKIVFFMASCFVYFGYYSKGCLSATPFFSLLGVKQ